VSSEDIRKHYLATVGEAMNFWSKIDDIELLQRLQIACNECLFLYNLGVCPEGTYPEPCRKLKWLRKLIEKRRRGEG